MEIKVLLTCIIALLVLFGAAGLIREYINMKRISDGHEERIAKLEAANRKRMPYEAFERILDARAAINKEKEEFQFFISLMENAEAHLEQAMSAGTKREEK